MDGLLLLLGRVLGVGGLVLCIFAGVVRLAGNFYLGSFAVATLLQAGIAAVVVGCFFLLLVLTGRANRL